jgi:nitrilase
VTTRAAVVQLNSGPDPQANLATIAELVAEAAAGGARLVVLPENCTAMVRGDEARLALAEPDGRGAVQQALAALAARHALWLVAGTLPIAAPDGRAFASCLVFRPDGSRAARYDKVHLFDVEVPGGEVHRESRATAPGRSAVVVETPAGVLGLSVCYDLRFPELYRALVERGATLLAVPAAFTAVTGAAHWEVLLRARAIEDQCYVLAAAQDGQHPGGRQTHGASMIIDPWGEVLACRAHGPGVLLADIDPARLVGLRQRFPVLEHRRPLQSDPAREAD